MRACKNREIHPKLIPYLLFFSQEKITKVNIKPMKIKEKVFRKRNSSSKKGRAQHRSQHLHAALMVSKFPPKLRYIVLYVPPILSVVCDQRAGGAPAMFLAILVGRP